ncbi:MAG: carboxypeptidase regulatory-like domain-containing protein [Planctomycetes bacterium]|nr:carboxypeptidase regulatory-like domain-containing protein [Planctomycetota bacterium]
MHTTPRRRRSLHVAAALGAMVAPVICQQSPRIVLAGRVVDMRGEPLPDAEVWVESALPEATAWRTRTDGDGMYRLGVPREDIRHLYARARGHCSVAHRLQEPFAPFRVVLHEAATVRGVLRNAAGAPVAAAVMFARPRTRPGNAVAKATTDEQGKFAITGVALGSNQIAAWIQGEGVVKTTARIAGDTEIELAPTGDPTTSMTVHLRGRPNTRLDPTTRLLFLALRVFVRRLRCGALAKQVARDRGKDWRER